MLSRIFVTETQKRNVTVRGLCVDSTLCWGDWIGGGMDSEVWYGEWAGG